MTKTNELKAKKLQKILLVEDDLGIRTTLAAFLESLEVNYTSACNGEEAIAILQSQHIDVLITDFRMPKVDGVELLNWCRKNKKHFPVIFLSANAELLKKENIALEDCCASLIRKPLLLDDLEKTLDAALARQHHENCVHEHNSSRLTEGSR